MSDAVASDAQPLLAAGFWRRLCAFAIDVFLLSLACMAAGSLATDALASLGSAGRLLGGSIATLYFGMINSALTGGGGLGKRVLGIKVVGHDGAPISVRASTVRAFIVCVPVFLNGAYLGPAMSSLPSIMLAAFLVFGVGGALLYLLVFNRATRRSLHDIAAGSFVVARDRPRAPVAPITLPPLHRNVTVAILLAGLALPLALLPVAQSPTFAWLTAVQARVAEDPGVEAITVEASLPGAENSYCSLTVNIRSWKPDDTHLATRYARLALDAAPEVASVEMLNVTLVYGYDIGLAAMRRSQTFSHSPADWRAMVAATP